MKHNSIVAALEWRGMQISAEYSLSTGRLSVFESGKRVEDFLAPDSWMALAAVSASSRWGTRPSVDDLLTFLQRYVEVFGEDEEHLTLRPKQEISN